MIEPTSFNQADIVAPLFLVGTGRSGSTIVFEAIAQHEQLAWITSHDARFPRSRVMALHHYGRRWQWIDRVFFSGTKQSKSSPWVQRIRATPSEAYPKWERLVGRHFRYGFLRNRAASPAEADQVRSFVASLLHRQGKARWVCKITGPTRLLYLKSIFPDGRFIYVYRDPRAVVESTLRATFFHEQRPRWPEGLDAKWIELWQEHGGTPSALAAVQVAAILEVYEEEKATLPPGCIQELAYEEFVRRPLASLEAALQFAELPGSPAVAAYAAKPGRYANQNKKRPAMLQPSARRAVDAILGEVRTGLPGVLENAT